MNEIGHWNDGDNNLSMLRIRPNASEIDLNFKSSEIDQKSQKQTEIGLYLRNRSRQKPQK